MLIHNKDDIQFVTEFPCFLGHPVWLSEGWIKSSDSNKVIKRIKLFGKERHNFTVAGNDEYEET